MVILAKKEDIQTELGPGDEKLVQLLTEVYEHRTPGWDPRESLQWFSWDHLDELYRKGMLTWGPEPLGTFFDGREEYGTIVRITTHGIDEIEAWHILTR